MGRNCRCRIRTNGHVCPTATDRLSSATAGRPRGCSPRPAATLSSPEPRVWNVAKAIVRRELGPKTKAIALPPAWETADGVAGPWPAPRAVATPRVLLRMGSSSGACDFVESSLNAGIVRRQTSSIHPARHSCNSRTSVYRRPRSSTSGASAEGRRFDVARRLSRGAHPSRRRYYSVIVATQVLRRLLAAWWKLGWIGWSTWASEHARRSLRRCSGSVQYHAHGRDRSWSHRAAGTGAPQDCRR